MKSSLGILIFSISLVLEGCIIVSIANTISAARFTSIPLESFALDNKPLKI